MKALEIDYSMNLEFSVPVTNQYFVLRCVPSSRENQVVTKKELIVEPSSFLTKVTDIFGNDAYCGHCFEAHTKFSFCSKAIVQVNDVQGFHDVCLPLYKYSTVLTRASQSMRDFLYDNCANARIRNAIENGRLPSGEVYEFVQKLSSIIFNRIEYKPGVTNIRTTAEDSFMLGKGVCQDFAHIICSLCRLCGIPAKYVCGTSKGEGTTHAWAEFFVCDEDYIVNDGREITGKWFGIDPTRNKMTDSTYVILGEGRDFSDCEVDRGIFYGNADQKQTIFVKTREIKF